MISDARHYFCVEAAAIQSLTVGPSLVDYHLYLFLVMSRVFLALHATRRRSRFLKKAPTFMTLRTVDYFSPIFDIFHKNTRTRLPVVPRR